MRVRKPVADYWFENYINRDVADNCHHLCSLCGNRGIVDTRGRAISAKGLDAGRLNYCICPNGQALRTHKAPLMLPVAPLAVTTLDLRENNNGDVKAAQAEVDELVKSIATLVDGKSLSPVITALRMVLATLSMFELDEKCREAEPAERLN